MARIIKSKNVRETRLWKILKDRESIESDELSVNVSSMCDEAIDRMKAMYSYAPQYTLHDDCHLLRTTELMGLLLGDVARELNNIELYLLILSAFFHDQGMVMLEDEFERLERDEQFQLFKDNWRVDHPNYGETTTQIYSSTCSEKRKIELASLVSGLDAAMFTDYIRETHGVRVSKFIRSTYGHDKRLEIQAVNIAPFLAILCESHTLPVEALNPQAGFHYDEQIGTYTVNLPVLSAVLRLADILDFDRDRTPEALLKSIHFTSPVSLHEWEKHRSVEGWLISPDLIRFTIRCKHPAYEATARQYMDWVDGEIAASMEICRLQPRNIKGYYINLPSHVDRSRIQPIDDAYEFHDLEFSLSRDEIVRLLMTDKLYGNEHLCIRELLQNSLDAIRYRKALFSESNIQWCDGSVAFRHYINSDGYEVLECTDNGSGMDKDIISNFFVRVGRSFYRSPYFDRERNRLKASGNDFDPCSKFGIGFMSCFMLGDRITIKTRRDYGYGREKGQPIVAEIHGLSGLLVVRKGNVSQPIGTTISIVSRQRPSFLDTWTDKVKLCLVLKGYALATEFPITADCDVPEIKETLTIPPKIEIIPTLLERAGLKKTICLQQNLGEISPNLRGFARETFLMDDESIPCLSNSEAGWNASKKMSRKIWKLSLFLSDREVENCFRGDDVSVCMDGILIAGPPGRPSFHHHTQRLGHRNSMIYSYPAALIDARGELKPEITPGRVPPDHMGSNLPPGWRRLADAFNQGLGLLWEQFANYLHNGMTPETFWKLTVINDISVKWIPCDALWKLLLVSMVKEGHETKWLTIRELGELSIFQSGDNTFSLQDHEGWEVGPNEGLDSWEKEGNEHPHLHWAMNTCVLLMSSLDVRDGKITLNLLPPTNRQSLAPYAKANYYIIDYVGNATDALAVQTPFPTANRNHPLSQLSHQARYVHAPTDLQSFAMSFVSCISAALNPGKSVSLDSPGYWHKRVGHLYFSVQWDHVDDALKPPYRLWREDTGWFLFKEEDFLLWADSDATMD